MFLYGLSDIELRSYIERVFWPINCVCTVDRDAETLKIRLHDSHTGRTADFQHIPFKRIEHARSLNALIAELRLRWSESEQETRHAHAG